MITSKDNSTIKYIKSLSQKKYRDENGEYIVEGIKMCKEAFEYGNVTCVVVCKELLKDEYSFYNECIKFREPYFLNKTKKKWSFFVSYCV